MHTTALPGSYRQPSREPSQPHDGLKAVEFGNVEYVTMFIQPPVPAALDSRRMGRLLFESQPALPDSWLMCQLRNAAMPSRSRIWLFVARGLNEQPVGVHPRAMDVGDATSSTHQSHALPNKAANSCRYFLSVSSNPFFSAQSISTCGAYVSRFPCFLSATLALPALRAPRFVHAARSMCGCEVVLGTECYPSSDAPGCLRRLRPRDVVTRQTVAALPKHRGTVVQPRHG